jgi:signal transduction histidine kinase
VLHKLGTAVAIYGADERLKFFNHAFVHLWHLDENWLRGEPTMGEVLEGLRDQRRLPEIVDFPAFKAEQRKMFTSLIAPVEELTHLPDGTTLRAVITPHPFGGLLLTWEDVTDTIALERSYNTLMAVQRETLDNLYEGIAVIGGDGRLQLSNPAFGRMWRLPDHVLDAAPHISEIVEHMPLFIAVDDDWPAQKAEIIAILTDREGSKGRIERADGSVLDYATMPLPDGAVLISYLDVSDSIQVERALRERNEALETADRLKSEFIANVSYELRTPLNTIIGFAEILNGQYFGELNQRQSEYSDGILESSHRLLSLINDILDLATIESGHMAIEHDTVNLHDMLSSVLSLSRELVAKKNLTLEFDCPLDIGTIIADERRLKQALFNIMSNAVKFTPENGTITVSAARADGQVVITFTDTGIGISEADRPRVFLRFERGSNPEARRSGAGLGLALVKSFIELHGGQVELDSQEGVGTTVRCVLPAGQADDADDLRIGTG